MRTLRRLRSFRAATTVAACALLAGGLSCQAPPQQAGPAGGADAPRDTRADEGAVIAAHRSLVQAFQSGNVEAALALLEPTPELLIFHPYLENRFDGIDDARAGLPRMLGRLQQLEWTEVHPLIEVYGDVAWITSQVLVKSSALEGPFIGRGTEIWIRRPDGWRLIHGHWSEHASLAGAKARGKVPGGG